MAEANLRINDMSKRMFSARNSSNQKESNESKSKIFY